MDLGSSDDYDLFTIRCDHLPGHYNYTKANGTSKYNQYFACTAIDEAEKYLKFESQPTVGCITPYVAQRNELLTVKAYKECWITLVSVQSHHVDPSYGCMEPVGMEQVSLNDLKKSTVQQAQTKQTNELGMPTATELINLTS